MIVGADLIFRSNPDYTSWSCKGNSVSHPALLCQVTMDKQPVRAGTTLILADFSAPVALLSWVMSSTAAMTAIYPSNRHTWQPLPLRSQQSPVLSSALSPNCPWPWVICLFLCFISLGCKPDYTHLPFLKMGYKCHTKWEGKITYPLIQHLRRLLSRAFVSWISISSETTAAGGEMWFFSHIQEPVSIFTVNKCSPKNILANFKCKREKYLKR